MKLTDLLDQIQERSRTAGEHVARLCTKEDRWKMSVPVQDDDSDILLTQITDRDVPQLAKALRAVMELHPCLDLGDLHEPDYICASCVTINRFGGWEHTKYPCPTVQAITDQMEGDND